MCVPIFFIDLLQVLKCHNKIFLEPSAAGQPQFSKSFHMEEEFHPYVRRKEKSQHVQFDKMKS